MKGLERAKARSLYVLPYFLPSLSLTEIFILIKMKRRREKFLTKKEERKNGFLIKKEEIGMKKKKFSPKGGNFF